MTVKEIAWLAGLLEGEGCFSKRKNCVTIQINMTDCDVVRKSANLVGARSVGRREDKRANCKPCFYWTIAGPRAAGWMMTVYPLMGKRRQARIRELLGVFKKAGPWGYQGRRLQAENLISYTGVALK